MPAPMTGTVPYKDRKNMDPPPGVSAVQMSMSGSAGELGSRQPTAAGGTDPLYDEFQATARRRIMLTRRPTPMTNEEIDTKPYSLLIPPPASSARAASAGRMYSPTEEPNDILRAFGKVSDRLRTGTSSLGFLPAVESSGIPSRDRTALIISILRTNITPPSNPDLAGTGHSMPVRRFYTINNMYSQIF